MHHLVIPTRSGLLVVVGKLGRSGRHHRSNCINTDVNNPVKKKAKEEKGLENRKVLLHVKEKQN